MGKLAKLLFVVFLVLYFVVTVLSRVPAVWLASTVVKAVPGLTLGGVSGTMWSGRASAANVQLPGDVLDLGGLSWTLDPSALLSLQACIDIKSGLIRGNVCRGISGENKIKNVMVDDFPVSQIGNMIGAELAGVGSIAIQSAVVNDRGSVTALQGNLTWTRARGNGGGGWYPLGSFAADLSANGNGGVRADVIDTEGEFEVKMEGNITVGEPPRVKGIIKPRPNAPQILIDTLGVFTEALDDGSFRLTWPIGS